tara:strand:+ start:86 stop:337 length:252 start_codon:yes stop_codon:yes gene_type:complete
MVWIIRITIIIFLFTSHNLHSNNLSKDEEMYFNFIDFNNDNQISFSEIEQSINIIFKIVDFNQDGFISKSEINELKNIVDSLK